MNHIESEISDDLSINMPPHPEHAHGKFQMPPLEGYKGTPEEKEAQWFEKVYTGRGDSMAQLTFRSTLIGCLLGAVMAIPNLYLGLKSGMIQSVGLTCTLMGFVVWQVINKTRLNKGKLTVLEYNAMASTASAAGYTTVGVLVSTIAAFLLINGKHIPMGWLMAWVGLTSILGITMAIPMKRQIINVDQLPFPGVIATAETLELLVSESKDSIRSARALFAGAFLGVVVMAWEKLDQIAVGLEKYGVIAIEGKNAITDWSSSALDGKINNVVMRGIQNICGIFHAEDLVVPEVWGVRSLVMAWDTVLFASGVFMGLRMCVTMLVSCTLCWGVYIPLMDNYGFIHAKVEGHVTGGDYRQYTLWGAASCMIVSGLVAVAFQWRTFVNGGKTVLGLFSKKKQVQEKSAMQKIEAPMSWFFWGQIICGTGLAFVGEMVAGIPWWQTALAVLLSCFLSLITCRITGETNSPPNAAMSKVTQFTFGAMNPIKNGMDLTQQATVKNINLLSAGLTTGAALNAADLLTDLKAGYFLGANPRKQFLAQFFGIFVGAVVAVILFRVLVPSKATLEGKDVYVQTVVNARGEKTEIEIPETVQVQKDEQGKAFIFTHPQGSALAVMEKTEVEARHIKATFSAPSAFAWKGISEVVAGGWDKLPAPKKWTMVFGALVGLFLSLIPKLFPKTASWMPSPGVVSTAWLFMWNECLLMFLGGLGAWAWEKSSKKTASLLLIPLASGLFVGASLMAVGVSFFANGKEILESLMGAFSK